MVHQPCGVRDPWLKTTVLHRHGWKQCRIKGTENMAFHPDELEIGIFPSHIHFR